MEHALYILAYVWNFLGEASVLLPLLGLYLSVKNYKGKYPADLKFLGYVVVIMAVFQIIITTTTHLKINNIFIVYFAISVHVFSIVFILLRWLKKFKLITFIIPMLLSIVCWIEYLMLGSEVPPTYTMIYAGFIITIFSGLVSYRIDKTKELLGVPEETFRMAFFLYGSITMLGFTFSGIKEIAYLSYFIHVIATVLANYFYMRGFQCTYRRYGLFLLQ